MSQLDRSLDVLEFLAERGEAGAGEISQRLALPRASVYRLLNTLETRGYIARAPQSKRFRLGLAIQALASQASSSLVVSLAAPALADLCLTTGETANLGVLSGGRIFYGASRDGANVPRMPASVGEEIEPHATAIGKAILALVPSRDRATLLGPSPYSAFTDRTITSPEHLERELALTAERGYAVDDGEIAVGAVCIAAAIVDSKGYPLAALSISGIDARLPSATRPAAARPIQAWCKRIANALHASEQDFNDFAAMTLTRSGSSLEVAPDPASRDEVGDQS
jgi:DNA-binding IclR family transcriptional regulator